QRGAALSADLIDEGYGIRLGVPLLVLIVQRRNRLDLIIAIELIAGGAEGLHDGEVDLGTRSILVETLDGGRVKRNRNRPTKGRDRERAPAGGQCVRLI